MPKTSEKQKVLSILSEMLEVDILCSEVSGKICLKKSILVFNFETF